MRRRQQQKTGAAALRSAPPAPARALPSVGRGAAAPPPLPSLLPLPGLFFPLFPLPLILPFRAFPVFSELPFSVRSPDRNWGARPVYDRAPGSIPPDRALPGPAPRSPLRGLRPSGDDPCRLRSLRSLRAPLATGTTEADPGRRADRPAHLRTLRRRSRAKNLNRTLAQLRRRREGLTREGSWWFWKSRPTAAIIHMLQEHQDPPARSGLYPEGCPLPAHPPKALPWTRKGGSPPSTPDQWRFAPWTPDRGCAPGPACRALP